MQPRRSPMNPQWRVARHLHLGDDVADGRFRSRKRYARRLAHQAAPSIAPDQITRANRSAVAEHCVHTDIVLTKVSHVGPEIGRHAEFVDPVAEDALGVHLPEAQPERESRWEFAQVKMNTNKTNRQGFLALCEKAINN